VRLEAAAFQAVLKDRSVVFLEHVRPDLDDVVGGDSQDKVVVGGMVELAQGQAVRHDRLAFRGAVWKNVRGVEQLSMPKAA
jgi:hypothetical protein